MAETSLIFDLDGTLIDSAPDIHAAVNRVLAEADIAPFTLAEITAFVGNGVDVLMARCLTARRLDDAGLHQRLVQRLLEVYEASHSLTTLYPNVASALSLVSNPLGICTNKPFSPALSVLRHFDLAQLFPVIIGGDTLAQKKPDPAPLAEAIRRMGNGPALFIGDSEVDAATAQAAQVPFVLFTQGYRKTPADKMAAAAQFDDWAEFPAVVARLTRDGA